ncbi:hypothetical protein E2I00_003448 [Balaenoptera physalus]|uniref:Uncharacterized protein n=1 Tax=Balaenoptera physalus TaxID=9770 RepID=A0A643C4E3_BALPH|nr:hypothetical protein E2I00_003448 [Balaenoptera physalus]
MSLSVQKTGVKDMLQIRYHQTAHQSRFIRDARPGAQRVSLIEKSSDQRNEETEGSTEHSEGEIKNDGEVTAQGKDEDDEEVKIQGEMETEEDFEFEEELESDIEATAPEGEVTSPDLAYSDISPGEVARDEVGPTRRHERARRKTGLEDREAPGPSKSRGVGVISTEPSQQVSGSSEQMDQESEKPFLDTPEVGFGLWAPINVTVVLDASEIISRSSIT